MLQLHETCPEMRYGVPAADQIIYNRYFTTGYSYYFRQAKWALEVVNSNTDTTRVDEYVDRMDNFRSDLRVPATFRAELRDYVGTGYDRGHLVASANQRDERYQNSETFLLSNMSPQTPQLNRAIWRRLEERIRELDAREDILETFVICGPVFDFRRRVDVLGDPDGEEITIPIPHHHFKSVLSEDYRGKLKCYSFILPNEPGIPGQLEDYVVPTIEVEYKAGIYLWDRIDEGDAAALKSATHEVWW